MQVYVVVVLGFDNQLDCMIFGSQQSAYRHAEDISAMNRMVRVLIRTLPT